MDLPIVQAQEMILHLLSEGHRGCEFVGGGDKDGGSDTEAGAYKVVNRSKPRLTKSIGVDESICSRLV